MTLASQHPLSFRLPFCPHVQFGADLAKFSRRWHDRIEKLPEAKDATLFASWRALVAEAEHVAAVHTGVETHLTEHASSAIVRLVRG